MKPLTFYPLDRSTKPEIHEIYESFYHSVFTDNVESRDDIFDIFGSIVEQAIKINGYIEDLLLGD